MAANKPFLVDGNSVVVKLVGKGEAWVGLTDSDDIADGQTWFGYPAQPDRQMKRQLIALHQLPELLRRVAELEKKMGISREKKQKPA